MTNIAALRTAIETAARKHARADASEVRRNLPGVTRERFAEVMRGDIDAEGCVNALRDEGLNTNEIGDHDYASLKRSYLDAYRAEAETIIDEAA